VRCSRDKGLVVDAATEGVSDRAVVRPETNRLQAGSQNGFSIEEGTGL
jgi:hypothetical protein